MWEEKIYIYSLIFFRLRLCLFWVKIISENAFPKMRLFGWSGKFYFPEIEIRWLKKTAFDHGNAFTLLFSLQSISGKCERERESARARERGEDPGAIASSNSSPRRDRDPKSRSRRGRRWWFYVFSGLWLVFSDLCFPTSFPNTKKYFSENFLKCNQTHGNIFLFRKLAFPENMYFPENVLQQPNTALVVIVQ